MSREVKWIQIKVDCPTEQLDTVCAVMSAADSHLMIDDPADVAEANPVYGELIDEELLKKRDLSSASVSIFLSEDKNVSETVSFIDSLLSSAGTGCRAEVITVDEEDWADNWKKYYRPVKIGRRLTVVPEWESYDAAPGELIIKMDPGMAFGTGTHESTQLCASLLEEFMAPGARVLDVGTGSGILAVAASKLGASEVEAFDIDAAAVKVASENIAKNGCENVRCGVSDLMAAASGRYDFITANITAEILRRMAPSVSGHLKKGGFLAVSGVIEEQSGTVGAAMEAAGLSFVREEKKNGWSGIVFSY